MHGCYFLKGNSFFQRCESFLALVSHHIFKMKCIFVLIFLLFITFCLIAQFAFIEIRLIEIFVGVSETVVAIVLIVLLLTTGHENALATENEQPSIYHDVQEQTDLQELMNSRQLYLTTKNRRATFLYGQKLTTSPRNLIEFVEKQKAEDFQLFIIQ